LTASASFGKGFRCGRFDAFWRPEVGRVSIEGPATTPGGAERHALGAE
jgi:hypothetical protein